MPQGIEEYYKMNPTQQMGIMLFAEGLKKGGIEKFKKDAADIANVMKNRLDRGFENSMTEVLTSPNQFSGLGSEEFMKAYSGNLDDDEQEMLKEALRISKGVLAGTIEDTTGGADHYYNPDAVETDPLFSEVYSKTKDGVAHKFYNGEDPVKDKKGNTYFDRLNEASRNNYKQFKWKNKKWDNRYYEEPQKKQEGIEFGDAFSQAREQGLEQFEWQGNKYTTEMK